MRDFLRFAIESTIPTDDECAKDEEACMWLHPIHGAGWVNGQLRSVYADVDGLISYIMGWVGNVYVSTSCQHGEHEDHNHCQSTSAIDGQVKIPARCKFCDAKCFCACHRKGVTRLSRKDLSAYVHHEPH